MYVCMYAIHRPSMVLFPRPQPRPTNKKEKKKHNLPSLSSAAPIAGCKPMPNALTAFITCSVLEQRASSVCNKAGCSLIRRDSSGPRTQRDAYVSHPHACTDTQRISSMIGHQFHRRVVSSKKPIRMLAQHHVNMSAIADAFARQELIHQTENHTSCVRNASVEIRARKCVRHGVEPVLNTRSADR